MRTSPPRLLLIVVLIASLIAVAAWQLPKLPGRFSRTWLAASRQSISEDNAAGASGTGPQLQPVQLGKKGGFDVRNVIVPVNELRSGGPPKDGIPALTNPSFVVGAADSYLSPTDRVIGYADGNEARAYPLRILTQHEIVNDRVNKLPIAVTYCPLCDSAAIFDRRTPAGELEFGVSGLLYNSNVLMYDRRNRPASLWSQMMTASISGPAVGKTLAALPLDLTTWHDWLSRYPHTTVLSPKTGHRRDYARNPYARYFRQPQLMFSVRPSNNLLPLKTPVLGVWTDKAARAYVVSSFGRAPREVTDTLDGKSITLLFNPAANSLRVTKADEGVRLMYSFWFAWYAFRPQTDIFKTP